MKLNIEFEALDPPQGWTSLAASVERLRFEGWLGLIGSIEALVAAAVRTSAHPPIESSAGRRGDGPRGRGEE